METDWPQEHKKNKKVGVFVYLFAFGLLGGAGLPMADYCPGNLILHPAPGFSIGLKDRPKAVGFGWSLVVSV